MSEPYPDRDFSIMHREWTLWRELCEALVETGAVTMTDLESSVKNLETPGQRLFEKIRAWGDSLSELRVAEIERKERIGRP